MSKAKEIKELIEKLNETGGAVYPEGLGDPIPFCFAGILRGRIWYHLGDVPHFGPNVESMEPAGDGQSLLALNEDKKLAFYMTTIQNAPELRTGQALDDIEDMREIMSREQAIDLLGPGEPPEEDLEAPTEAEPPGSSQPSI